ncbi:hypothetical protein U14_00975 [Candidatus Moduliflexus flocculans]|uniref:Uncharacterized protein n=1 Tax=Candidatus Moduliflexus flocculans TaxID=1499966 RepID=A0A0S6VRF0_9BACT|nr:hypothetical protein U14_00975 [Candidatus Moduliflexus flocculans]
MLEAVSRNGMMIEKLFVVSGDLVENYNRVLEQVISKRTQTQSFHIDKRGESPELEKEFGENYLQSGPSHRYCLIVSPEQSDADLIHKEFSFDDDILNDIYKNFLSGISLATRVDGLFGELDDHVNAYETFEDLLQITHVHLELHTPSKFLSTARTLLEYAEQLKKQPNLLLENDSEHLRKMLKLVGEVGDVRGYDLRPIEATKELDTFYSRLFGGVAVFRNAENRSPLPAKQVDQEHLLYDLSGDALTIVPPELPPMPDTKSGKKPAPSKTVVLYREKEYHPEDGPLVQFISFQEKLRIIEFLRKYWYADFSVDLLEPALIRIEDETMLSKGHDVTQMTPQQRAQALYQYRETMLPAWYELNDVKRKLTKGHELATVVAACSPETQSMLLTSATQDDNATDVVEYVITRLDEFRHEKMFLHNRRHLERQYPLFDANKQKYIVQVLSRMKK